MDFTALARQASVGDGSELSGDAVHRFGELVAATAKAKEREAHDYTKGKLAGALAALRQLQECVPPKDWKRYASDVLALDARDRERSNGSGERGRACATSARPMGSASSGD